MGRQISNIRCYVEAARNDVRRGVKTDFTKRISGKVLHTELVRLKTWALLETSLHTGRHHFMLLLSDGAIPESQKGCLVESASRTSLNFADQADRQVSAKSL